MKVSLISHTQDAQELLIFSKKTRLNMSADSFNHIKELPAAEKEKEINYVFGTIGSSWEFIDYVFMLEGVTRAFTHQLVRHRVGVSFAQQSQRTVDASGFKYLATGGCYGNKIYDDAMAALKKAYADLIQNGVKPEDARGLLPTNVLTNILMKVNLRSLSDMMRTRLCVRAQSEFRIVMRAMKQEVLAVHPWTEPVLKVQCELAGIESCPFKNFTDCPKKQK